jgi:hypothetical protein
MPHLPNLHFSKHNTIKVTLKDGSTIFARITRINEATGKVCWIDRDEKWKGSMHASRVVVATPKEVADWAVAKASKIPEIDPIMKDWDVSKMRRGPQMMEGYYYSSNISLYGKKVGKIVDYGNGGPIDLEFADMQLQKKFIEDCKKWAVANGGSETDGFEEFWSWMTEDRPKGMDAKASLAEKKAWMAELDAKYGNKTVTHTGDLALINGQI